jgi:hypothetical protein
MGGACSTQWEFKIHTISYSNNLKGRDHDGDISV